MGTDSIDIVRRPSQLKVWPFLKEQLLFFLFTGFTTALSIGETLKCLVLTGMHESVLLIDHYIHCEAFNRFTERAKRPQLCHMPFGYGPRNCIGMRFALLEIKIALIELLKRYSFVRVPDTEVRVSTVWIMCSIFPYNKHASSFSLDSLTDCCRYHPGTKEWHLPQSD